MAAPNPGESHSAKNLEKLYGATVLQSAIEVTVISTGCTTASDFVIESRISGQLCDVRIRRTRPDLCKRLPMTESIKLPWSQSFNCERRDIQLANEIQSVTTPGLPVQQGGNVNQNDKRL